MPKIEVERKDLDIDYHLESIIAEMLKYKTRTFSDQRAYTVTLTDEYTNQEFKETVTAKIEITLTAPDTLLEKASQEEE